jgi:hypothetical protein
LAPLPFGSGLIALCDASHGVNKRFPVQRHHLHEATRCRFKSNGMTTMTNIQITKVLSDADLDTVAGGISPFLAMLEIRNVERSNEPNAIKAMQIHNIQAETFWPFRF